MDTDNVVAEDDLDLQAAIDEIILARVKDLDHKLDRLLSGYHDDESVAGAGAAGVLSCNLCSLDDCKYRVA
jgi:hypothetical protein